MEHDMSSEHLSRLRFNFGFLVEAPIGTSRLIELDYPSVEVGDDVVLSPLTGSFTATRTSEGVYLQGKLHSVTITECVRCLGEAEQPVTAVLDDLLFSPPESAPEGELVIDKEGTIDLAPLIRELSVLAIPISTICRPDCSGLCMVCGQNLNEADCGCEEHPVNPRMAVLQQLLDNNK